MILQGNSCSIAQKSDEIYTTQLNLQPVSFKSDRLLSDADFATRWRLIKINFSKAIPSTERISAVRAQRGERGIWQRRYWEHLIRDEQDYRARMDYVHINPVKHG